ncbi:MAG TPA: hypothetical protein VI299_21410, partial [Polyangiales bacterium]
MEALKRLSLAVAMLALAGVGCGDDDDDGVVDSGIDGGTDSGAMDAHVPDSAKPDSSTPDSSVPTFSCKGGTPPTASMCGGLHCEQTPAQFKMTVKTGAACATDLEQNGVCQLSGIVVAQDCTVQAFLAGNTTPMALTAATKTCAMGKQPTMGYSDACLNCFVAGGVCAAAHCAAQ